MRSSPMRYRTPGLLLASLAAALACSTRSCSTTAVRGVCRYSTRTPSIDRKSTRLNSSHRTISYAVFCLKKKNKHNNDIALGDYCVLSEVTVLAVSEVSRQQQSCIAISVRAIGYHALSA